LTSQFVMPFSVEIIRFNYTLKFKISRYLYFNLKSKNMIAFLALILAFAAGIIVGKVMSKENNK
jgi:ABC-type uncharacterized transport system permease subunit